MIKIDLITGFLGSGKTTFLKKYARFLMDQGLKIGILENDYGAVNVDMMLLQELEGKNCTLEMVAGGCDMDCHRRRFKTKLIAMGMSGYDRVLVEPSGIFDVDEFFDALYEEPLCRWYEVGSVFAIVDAHMEKNMSAQAEYMLASQISNAGRVIFSKTKDVIQDDLVYNISYMNQILEKYQCERRLNDDELFDRPMATNKIAKANRVVCKDWDDFQKEDFEIFQKCGYVAEHFRKDYGEPEGYQSLYFMNGNFTLSEMKVYIEDIMQNPVCGNVFRIKGFLLQDKTWYEINATKLQIDIQKIEKGQEIVIVIGEELNQEQIELIFQMKANEL